MRTLYGKGVWAWQLKEVPRAIDMALAIDARIVLFKTGQEGEYFEHAARRAVQHIYDAGLVPCAWPVISCRDPDAEADPAPRARRDGALDVEGEAGPVDLRFVAGDEVARLVTEAQAEMASDHDAEATSDAVGEASVLSLAQLRAHGPEDEVGSPLH